MDLDLVACVYPCEGGITWPAIAANPRHIPPQPPTEHDSSGVSHLSRLEVRFSDIPRTSFGLDFGYDPNCDVVLPRVPAISSRQFSPTFDVAGRLIVKDWGSLIGTEVTYDNQGRGRRRNFQWIVGGDSYIKDKRIIVSVHNMTFLIVVAHHDITSQLYVGMVDRFRRGREAAEDLLGDLGILNHPETIGPTGAHTPNTGDIYLRKELGRGSFGVVTHLWNVRDGSQYALKEPSARVVRGQKPDYHAWLKEARIMGQISHPHVVRLLGSSFDPHPQLFLEFMPGGSLEEHKDITADETLAILRQCSSALAYLHEKKPPIVHRDVKPANVLVQHRLPGEIHVKFRDFGLSKDDSGLMTICGSGPYAAPEIYSEWQHVCSGGERRSYTPAVDIWSLGVVVYELLYGIPRYRRDAWDMGAAWCESLDRFQNDLDEGPDELRQFLLDSMVVLSPEARLSARDCSKIAMLIPRAADAGYQTATLTATSHATEDDQMTIRCGPEGHVADDRATVVWCPGPSGERTAESNAPETTPSVLNTTTKKTRVSKAPSSLSREWRSSPSAELALFEQYSPNPMHCVYVGSEIGESSSCESQSTPGSAQPDQPRDDGGDENQAPIVSLVEEATVAKLLEELDGDRAGELA